MTLKTREYPLLSSSLDPYLLVFRGLFYSKFGTWKVFNIPEGRTAKKDKRVDVTSRKPTLRNLL
jgi:hypothetical protein